MTDIASAIKALKDDAEFVISGEPTNEADYKANVKYVTGACLLYTSPSPRD